MGTASRFETLTNRSVLIQERTERFISDLQRFVRLLEADIEFDETRTGISDPANSSYSALARKLRARRDNLIATISQLQGQRERVIHRGDGPQWPQADASPTSGSPSTPPARRSAARLSAAY
jgi:hypothetical protein